MEVLIVLMVSLVLLRGVGYLGVERLSSWREAGLSAVAIMFLFTSTAHFSGMKHDLAAMMPEALPDGLWIIYLTGFFEIAGAIGLLVPRTRRLAGIGLVLLLIAQFPANVNAALGGIPLGGEPPTTLWLRTPMQLLFIAMVWWTSVAPRPTKVRVPPAQKPVLEEVGGSRDVVDSADEKPISGPRVQTDIGQERTTKEPENNVGAGADGSARMEAASRGDAARGRTESAGESITGP